MLALTLLLLGKYQLLQKWFGLFILVGANFSRVFVRARACACLIVVIVKISNLKRESVGRRKIFESDIVKP